MTESPPMRGVNRLAVGVGVGAIALAVYSAGSAWLSRRAGGEPLGTHEDGAGRVGAGPAEREESARAGDAERRGARMDPQPGSHREGGGGVLPSAAPRDEAPPRLTPAPPTAPLRPGVSPAAPPEMEAQLQFTSSPPSPSESEAEAVSQRSDKRSPASPAGAGFIVDPARGQRGLGPPPPSGQPTSTSRGAPGTPFVGKSEQDGQGAMTQVRMVTGAREVQVGDTLTIEVQVSDAADAGSVPFHVLFNPSVLRFEAGEEGSFMNSDGRQTAFFAAATSGRDEVVVGLSRLGRGDGIDGEGHLCRLRFSVVGPGNSGLAFTRARVRDSENRIVPSGFEPALVTAR